MAETAIEWTERSWNPVVGCSLATPGCTHCYAMTMAARIERMGTAPHYAGLTQPTKAGAVWTGKLAMAPEHVLLEPLRRKKPTTYFVNSMGDLFHEDVPDAWIDSVFAVVVLARALGQRHTMQILTKRAGRMRAYFEAGREALAERWATACRDQLNLTVNHDDDPEAGACAIVNSVNDLLGQGRNIGWPLRDVWLGVSAEDQKRADERIPDLLATPAAIRFVSAEPLLGPVDIAAAMATDAGLRVLFAKQARGELASERGSIHWIIVGGESGPQARPMHPAWARSIRDQCAAAGTAFFFKQWGEHRLVPSYDGSEEWPARWFSDVPPRTGDIARMDRVGKKRAGRLLDGVAHNAMPEAAR